MDITPEIEQWLKEAGYEYHCFISWARTKNKEMNDCAKKIKENIEEHLALSVPTPRVFLDESEIKGGDGWMGVKINESFMPKHVYGCHLCTNIFPSNSQMVWFRMGCYGGVKSK